METEHPVPREIFSTDHNDLDEDICFVITVGFPKAAGRRQLLKFLYDNFPEIKPTERSVRTKRVDNDSKARSAKTLTGEADLFIFGEKAALYIQRTLKDAGPDGYLQWLHLIREAPGRQNVMVQGVINHHFGDKFVTPALTIGGINPIATHMHGKDHMDNTYAFRCRVENVHDMGGVERHFVYAKNTDGTPDTSQRHYFEVIELNSEALVHQVIFLKGMPESLKPRWFENQFQFNFPGFCTFARMDPEFFPSWATLRTTNSEGIAFMCSQAHQLKKYGITFTAQLDPPPDFAQVQTFKMERSRNRNPNTLMIRDKKIGELEDKVLQLADEKSQIMEDNKLLISQAKEQAVANADLNKAVMDQLAEMKLDSQRQTEKTNNRFEQMLGYQDKMERFTVHHTNRK